MPLAQLPETAVDATRACRKTEGAGRVKDAARRYWPSSATAASHAALFLLSLSDLLALRRDFLLRWLAAARSHSVPVAQYSPQFCSFFTTRVI